MEQHILVDADRLIEVLEERGLSSEQDPAC